MPEIGRDSARLSGQPNLDVRRFSPNTGKIQPQRSVLRAAIAGSTEVDAHPLDSARSRLVRAKLVRRPRFQVGHVDQRQRGLVLVAAGAGPRVVGSVQHAVGGDQVRGAARLETSEVAGAAVAEQIVVAGGTAAERQQILAGHRGAAAVAAVVTPRHFLARQRVDPGLRLSVEQIHGTSLPADRV